MNPYQNLWGDPIIGEGTKLAAFVDIGKGVIIGRNCSIQCFVNIPPGVVIHDNVFIGPQVCFTNHKDISTRGEWKMHETVVEERASIGGNATILPGIRIGKGAVIGAGAVVTKDVPAGETWAGNPARPL